MRQISLVIAFAALVLVTGATEAQQPPQRVRGTISGLEGNVLSVKAANGSSVPVQLAEKTVIVFTQPIAIGDIQPGDFLGVTSMKREDGALTAYEVRRFPKPLNPGHRPFDGRSDQTMTNAAVAAMVQSADGRVLTLTYEGGSQKITVPEGASISTLVPGNRAQLVPGAPVNLTARADDGGALTAIRIQVSPLKK